MPWLSLTKIQFLTTVFQVLLGLLPASSDPEFNIKELEMRQEEITEKLHTLARLSLNSGVAPIGYRSGVAPPRKPEHEWVEIHLQEPSELDLIVVVPSIFRVQEGEFRDDGFPMSLKIMLKKEDGTEVILFDIPDTSYLLPRIAPVLFPVKMMERVTSVKISTDHLSKIAINGQSRLQLSEVMVFKDSHLLSLKQQVKRSSEIKPNSGWSNTFLVDGVTPYLMNVPRLEASRAYMSRIDLSGQPYYSFDLREERVVNGITLHNIEQTDTFPQAFSGEFGVPRKITLEYDLTSDFHNPKVAFTTEILTETESAPIMQWEFPEVQARYFRVKPERLYEQVIDGKIVSRTGFTEIELTQDGKNIIGDGTLSTNFSPSNPDFLTENMIDGKNFYGEIIPKRQWMEELALRHDLLIESKQNKELLQKKFKRQQKLFQLLKWLLGGITSLSIIGFLLYRLHRIKNETRIRERIAGNLHDALGANLHAIMHLGQLASLNIHSPKSLEPLIQEIDNIAGKTGTAARDCSQMLNSKHLCDDLPYELEREARSILADIEYTFKLENEKTLNKLSRRTKVDLLLFFKEAVINILRHSEATKVELQITSQSAFLGQRVSLHIIDNGTGMGNLIPPSLKRRAIFLNARISNLTPASGSHLHLAFYRFTLLP